MTGCSNSIKILLDVKHLSTKLFRNQLNNLITISCSECQKYELEL